MAFGLARNFENSSCVNELTVLAYDERCADSVSVSLDGGVDNFKRLRAVPVAGDPFAAVIPSSSVGYDNDVTFDNVSKSSRARAGARCWPTGESQ